MLGQLGEDNKVLSLQVKVKQENKGCVSAQGTFEVVLAIHGANNSLFAFNCLLNFSFSFLLQDLE